eukprot:2255325-Rhodomonas_salina.2
MVEASASVMQDQDEGFPTGEQNPLVSKPEAEIESANQRPALENTSSADSPMISPLGRFSPLGREYSSQSDEEGSASDSFELSSEIQEWVQSEKSIWMQFLEEEAQHSCRVVHRKTAKGCSPYNGLSTNGIAGFLLRNRKAQYVILFLSIFYFLVFGIKCYVLLSQRSVRGQVFKFEVVDNEHLAWMSSIADIGLMLDGCEIADAVHHFSDTDITVEFAEQVYVNGWFVESNVSAGLVPAVFGVLWSAGHGSPFQNLAPDSNFLAGCESSFVRSSAWSVDLRGEERTELHTLPCLPCAITSTIIWFALAAGSCLTSTQALWGKRFAADAAVGLS